ncbi:MAG: polysaccharide biosynthesis tyrosine autokinase [Myxococcales bacterium]|nr:polysaccharide biosynthesis tyrosine autokinase [Myxococcales bacterium]
MPTLVQPTPQPPSSGSSDFDLRQLIDPLFKYKWLIVSVAFAALALTYFWTLQRPRIYEADSTLEHDPNPARPLGRDIEDVSSQPFYFWANHEYYETQSKIIASRVIAERVARKLALHQNPDFMGVPEDERQGWKGAEVVAAAARVQGLLTVRRDKDTRIVHVMVKDQDPERAALVANAITSVYIDKTMEDRLGSTTTALEWLAEQLDSLKNQLERSELQLHEFTEEHEELNVPIDEQKKIVAADIHRFSGTLADARTRRIELEAKLDALQTANRENPLEVHATALSQNETISKLRSAYIEAEALRSELSTQYGAEHPKMTAVTARMAKLHEQIRAEVDGLIDAAESDLEAARDVEERIRGALDEANEAGLHLNLREIAYRRLERERDNTAKLYGTILQRTAETDLTRALEVAYVRVVDKATAPGAPISPRMSINLAVGGVLGLLLGVGLALLLGRLDRVIRTVEAAEALGITVLGVLPSIEESSTGRGPGYRRGKRNKPEPAVANRDMVVHTHPQSSVAECCRTIRTNLAFMSAETRQKVVLVTSPSPREGKTTVATSLAISMAQSGKRVLIVDTDLRKPRVHRALERNGQVGVTNLLVGDQELSTAVQETDVPGLSMLAAGPIPPNPSELLHTHAFERLVATLRERYDQVIFDSPPLTVVTDAAVVAPQIDGAILVIHSQRTTRDAAQSALRMLRDVGANITGAVMNDVDLASRKYGYGGYYYYGKGGYYAAEESDEQSSAPAAE